MPEHNEIGRVKISATKPIKRKSSWLAYDCVPVNDLLPLSNAIREPGKQERHHRFAMALRPLRARPDLSSAVISRQPVDKSDCHSATLPSLKVHTAASARLRSARRHRW